jgi:hypothetical protein
MATNQSDPAELGLFLGFRFMFFRCFRHRGCLDRSYQLSIFQNYGVERLAGVSDLARHVYQVIWKRKRLPVLMRGLPFDRICAQSCGTIKTRCPIDGSQGRGLFREFEAKVLSLSRRLGDFEVVAFYGAAGARYFEIYGVGFGLHFRVLFRMVSGFFALLDGH